MAQIMPAYISMGTHPLPAPLSLIADRSVMHASTRRSRSDDTDSVREHAQHADVMHATASRRPPGDALILLKAMHASVHSAQCLPQSRHQHDSACSTSGQRAQQLCIDHHCIPPTSPRRLRWARKAARAALRRSAGERLICHAQADATAIAVVPSSKTLRIPVAGSEVQTTRPPPWLATAPTPSHPGVTQHSTVAAPYLCPICCSMTADSAGDGGDWPAGGWCCHREARRDGVILHSCRQRSLLLSVLVVYIERNQQASVLRGFVSMSVIVTAYS